MKRHRKNNEKTSNDRSWVLTFVSYEAKGGDFNHFQSIVLLSKRSPANLPAAGLYLFVSLDSDLKMVTLVKR